ncbi:succinoglycan biosynthesis protein [Meridianimarinicoccus roseus]|uniref:Succinoglycan biosynthesis protein n=1 Tax=Meridianimarinicoccus roseus TaxID=2072018 RepID=A0A2V2LJI4_9RHOB|nr:thermonuclease family protein [Meridianimarinicoccus roseus]PWR03376.1 succinoglycan biosynthesis protein [Meridianimarinicoccus roseus]
MKVYQTAILAAALSMSVAPASAARLTGVAEVIDGDTLKIGVTTVRLSGIDAPEAGQACERATGRPWRCDEAATGLLEELVTGQVTECEVEDADQYGRMISTCYADGVNLNEALVDAGLAWAFIRYSNTFAVSEQAARKAGLGIWREGSEPTAPWVYRANRWERAAASSPRPGCPIKGNINSKGERIYHTPWSPWYARTKINTEKGERYFCDEAEAVSAGWRAARSR